MKEIRYSKHLQTKLTLRNIPGELVTDIYGDANERFSDKQTGYMVAVKQIEIYGHQLSPSPKSSPVKGED